MKRTGNKGHYKHLKPPFVCFECVVYKYGSKGDNLKTTHTQVHANQLIIQKYGSGAAKMGRE